MKKNLWLFTLLLLSVSCNRMVVPVGEKLVTDSIQVVRGDSLLTMNIVWAKKTNPSWLADSLNKALVRQFFYEESSDVRRVAQAEADSFYQDYLQYKSDFESEPDLYMPEWGRSITARLDRETEHYYIFSGSDYVYMGGAHGGFQAVEYAVDKQTGETLSWEQLFKNPDDEVLATLVRVSLEKQYFQSSEDVFYFVEGGKFPLPVSAPSLRDEGILFQYQQYEIAAYAYGLPGCVISYKDLMPYFNPEIIEKLPCVDSQDSTPAPQVSFLDRLRSLFKL
ncbi:MAG: DUF3298 domain-containing protein [Alloprevotella sp.]|nr:DUF3298 domain-containing protein [Alloprevotella sp.]